MKTVNASTWILIVDAFADRPFTGNPAAVCLLESPSSEAWMQSVAREVNLSATAFVYPIEEGWSLRWFTPTVEVKLCGHATLASAFVLWEMGRESREHNIRFHTLSGWLTCQSDAPWIEMDFPATAVSPCEIPPSLVSSLGCEPLHVARNSMDFLVEVADETILRGLRPNFTLLQSIPARGIIVTCRSSSDDYAFVSRFFAPAAGINEDPVTGSAHCALGPYWQTKTRNSDFTAFQASERSGIVKVAVRGDRVILKGTAVLTSRMEFLH